MEYTYRETNLTFGEIQPYIKDKLKLSDVVLLPLMKIIQIVPVGMFTFYHFEDVIWARKEDGKYFLSVNRRERLKGDVYG